MTRIDFSRHRFRRCIEIYLSLLSIGLFSLGSYVMSFQSTALGNNQACQPKRQSSGLQPEADLTGTFSIVAVDPKTGICGAAVASKYPAVGIAFKPCV